MLEVAVSAGPIVRRSVLGWAVGAFVLGALLSLVGMLAKPPALEFRFVETILVALGVMLASGGLLGVVASVRARPQRQAAAPIHVAARALLPGAAQAVVSMLALRVLVHAALVGVVPAPRVTLGIGVPALCLGLLWGVWRCADRLRAAAGVAEPESLFRRAWPTIVTVGLYLPALGSFGLIDCWEPQYSEVAREMLARHDWISLWWGDQAWFWSKPNLDFWLQGVSYSWFGLDPSPEAMLQGIAAGRSPAPEWAARLPNVSLAIGGQMVLAWGAARYFGRGAARFGALILATCPYWFLLARQTMVDMTYAAPLAAALGFLLLAGAAAEGEQVRTYRIGFGGRSLPVSGYHLLFVTIGSLVLVQVFYLLSRHASFELSPDFGLHFHRDRVFAGSPGNCTLPGNAPCRLDPEATGAVLQPGLSALLWALCLGVLVWTQRSERSTRGLFYLAAWTCVALSVMGKAAPGLVLPLCTFGGWLVLRGQLGELRRAKLPELCLILACVAAPWFVQEYARHGAPFFERLFLHDMYNRAFGHVHDTNSGVDTSFRYYVWQLGYGLFPWSGVAAVGVLFCLGKSVASGTDPRFRAGTELFVAWLLACFGLFSIAGTKFHHYILPLVPAAAMLGGVLLDELWHRGRASRLSLFGLVAAVPTVLIAIDLVRGGEMPGAALFIQLFAYLYTRPWPAGLDYRGVLGAFGVASVLVCLALEVPRARRWAVAGISAVGVAFTVWATDVYMIRVAPHWSQRETISEYYRARTGPEEPLVAYRQNWMGENFYTSNHLATFKTSGKPFVSWVDKQRKEGTRVVFFTTEHNTIEALKRELGTIVKLDLLTTPAENNKFVLARVEL